MPATFPNDPTGEKTAWRAHIEKKLVEMTQREAQGTLSARERRDPAYKDAPPGGLFNPDLEPVPKGIVKGDAFGKTVVDMGGNASAKNLSMWEAKSAGTTGPKPNQASSLVLH